MIDLSALGLPAVQTSHHGGKRQKSGAAHDNGKDAGNFGDLIGDAGKKNAKKQNIAGHEDQMAHGSKKVSDQQARTKGAGHHANAAVHQADADNDFDDADLTDIDPVDIDDLADADELIEADAPVFDDKDGGNAETQGRVRLSKGFQQLMKTNAEGVASNKADSGNAEIKAGKVQDKKDPDATEHHQAAANEKSKTSPSEELHALLGMIDDDDGEQAGHQMDAASLKPVAKRSVHDAEDKSVDTKDTKRQHAAEATVTPADAVDQAIRAHGAPAVTPVDAPLSRDADDSKAQSENGAKVQLISNAGKSWAAGVEMPKADEGDKASSTSASDIDFVSVVDSRRYLGFSGDGNAAALTNAIKADPSWAQALHEANARETLTATEVNTLKLQMNPEHLGNMTASLRLKGEELSVEVRVETVEAYRQLSSDQDSIVKALQDQGFSIDQVSIQLSPSARSDAGEGSGQNQSGNAGQNLQQGGQGDNARQRDESARRNVNQNNWMGNDKTSSFGNSGSNSDPSRNGNIYL